GAMAYELLTGDRPFARPNAAAEIRALTDEPHVPVDRRRDGLPVGLPAVIDRCLAKRPEKRYANGVELAAALEALQAREGQPSGGGVAAGPRSQPQEIRYCSTADGVSIAYAVIGQGPPLVRVLGWFTHLEMEWQWPEMRAFWERLAETRTVVRYDGRGIGLSEPWSGDFTEDTRRLDLDAVCDAAGAETAAFFGISEGGWTAARYAVDRPDRVSHLILYGAYCRGASARPGYDAEEDAALITLMRKGWGQDTPRFRRLFTDDFFPDGADLRIIAHFDSMQRTSADGETAARYLASCHVRGDGRAFFRTIRVPTLVLHSRDDRMVDFAEARLLASTIPDAELLPLPSGTHYFPSDQYSLEPLADAIGRHLRKGTAAVRGGSSPPKET
ncbi:MAG TPA: alpha/beta fold hydrolase, partial [Vicinamibacterales bacterium]|nr:alpha/beta fold hydrolase [Vicinamibacterales bacterium]